MYLKIALCDDSQADRAYLSGLAEQWAARAGHQVRVTCFESAERFLFEYAEKTITTSFCWMWRWGPWTGSQWPNRCGRKTT